MFSVLFESSSVRERRHVKGMLVAGLVALILATLFAIVTAATPVRPVSPPPAPVITNAALTSVTMTDDCDPNDEFSTCFVVYYPGLCHFLEPWSYWWYFWDCYSQMQTEAVASLEEETVTLRRFGRDHLRVQIERRFSDGTVQHVERLVRRPHGPKR